MLPFPQEKQMVVDEASQKIAGPPEQWKVERVYPFVGNRHYTFQNQLQTNAELEWKNVRLGLKIGW